MLDVALGTRDGVAECFQQPQIINLKTESRWKIERCSKSGENGLYLNCHRQQKSLLNSDKTPSVLIF